MVYYPPDIIDNAAVKFADALERSVREADQRHLDIATGYFAPDVWNIVGKAFAELESLRLLLGDPPDVPFGGTDTIDLRSHYRRKMAETLEKLDFDPRHARLVDDLLGFLKRDEVEVRVFASAFLHAKAYIFDRVSFVGSSNFTPSGLMKNSELMLSSLSEATAKGLRAWFESKWVEGTDYKPKLMETLDESKFGAKPYQPFDIFIKALHEYFKGRLILDQGQTAAVDLARFQEEGRNEAIRLLEKWNGVLIADAVGLGKTFIGLSLLEYEALRSRQRRRGPRLVLICPAQLRDLVWRPRLNEFNLVADVISQEELGRADFDWGRYRDRDVILVDESHNFRNPDTNRYRNLSMMIASGRPNKRVILMTATPVNNSLYDLYYQIFLLARGNNAFYRSIGIADLRKYFDGAINHGQEIFDLLEETTVRRSRADIRHRQEQGEEVIINGKPVRFPTRRLERVDYNLNGTYQGLYRELTAAITQLNLVAYNLAAFARTNASEVRQEAQRNQALIELMKILYLKRLESSAAAFVVSIKRQAQFQERFLALLSQGKLLDAAGYRKLVLMEAEEERQEQAEEVIRQLPTVDPDAYTIQDIKLQVAADLETLQRILQRVDQGGTNDTVPDDDKLRRIKTLLAGALRGRKVLIFTSFQDTALYLYQQLRDDTAWQQEANQPVLEVITGATRSDERKRLIERFAPEANRPAEEQSELRRQAQGEEIQILICTDVLSEGQNLQDAGVIINYDLHWNPVRLIQRAGRVDRIGSSFAQIDLYNCFPEDELENLLGLVQRLTERITQIDQTVGLDASVLGEAVSQRSLEQLRQLHRDDQQVLTNLERQAELISTEDMKLSLMSYIQERGESAVAEIPMGIHSGKRYVARNARPGTFIAFSAGDRHFWRFYPDDTGQPEAGSPAQPETQIRTIYAMIACAPGEPREDPGPIPYALLERATRDVLQSIEQEDARNRTPPSLSGLAKKLNHWLNAPADLWDGELDPEQKRRINGVLEVVSLQPFQHDQRLKKLVKTYEKHRNVPQLVAGLDTFFTEMDLYQQSNVDVITAKAIRKEDLRLVCYERLVPLA